MGDIKSEFNRLKKELFEGKTPVRPIFIIAFGPPGSGKTTVLNKLLKRYDEDPRNFVKILTDEIVEADVGYLNELIRLRNKNLPYKELSEKAQDLYFKYRRTADVLAELLVDIAGRQRYNTIYETTGSNSSISWLLYMIKSFRERGYEIWVYYPYVIDKTLFDRVKQRANTGKRIVPEETVRRISREAQQNFVKLLGKVDRLWIMDNNETSRGLRYIYESIIDYDPNAGETTKTSCKIGSVSIEGEFRKNIEKICERVMDPRTTLS